jgi:hypothetical protein
MAVPLSHGWPSCTVVVALPWLFSQGNPAKAVRPELSGQGYPSKATRPRLSVQGSLAKAFRPKMSGQPTKAVRPRMPDQPAKVVRPRLPGKGFHVRLVRSGSSGKGRHARGCLAKASRQWFSGQGRQARVVWPRLSDKPAKCVLTWLSNRVQRFSKLGSVHLLVGRTGSKKARSFCFKFL